MGSSYSINASKQVGQLRNVYRNILEKYLSPDQQTTKTYKEQRRKRTIKQLNTCRLFKLQSITFFLKSSETEFKRN